MTSHTGARLVAPDGVAQLALRRNPRRAHLLVSLLLGKHLPVPAADVLGAAAALGERVRAVVDGSTVVVGFAETATALGHGVAATLRSPYVHTTRRPLPAGSSVLTFQEEHSHATDQALTITSTLAAGDVVVLVDDELSTGRTAVNVARALQERLPHRRRRYVLASLLDVRTAARRAATALAIADLGADAVDVALHTGVVHLPADLRERAAALTGGPPRSKAASDGPRGVDLSPQRNPGSTAADAPPVARWCLTLPAGVPTSAAGGWTRSDEAGLRAAVDLLATRLPAPAVVLGDEECLYAGQLLAAALGVRTSSTTRSPALVVDATGYPLRSCVRWAADDGERYAYNVPAGADLALVTDVPPPATLVDALAAVAGRLDIVLLRNGSTASPTLTRVRARA